MKTDEITNLAIQEMPMSEKIKIMKSRKQSHKSASKSDTKPKTKRARDGGEAKSKRVSALDAAAQVLKASGQAMRSGEMIAAMAERGLWSSPNGKTPESTLYAAILREINTKGKDARFRKVERGKFEFAA